MTIVQKWLAGLIGLGALYLVATQGKGLATSLNAAQGFISGTEKTAITGK